jgi:hypothetical protein
MSAGQPALPHKLAKLIPMLSSPVGGEVVAAAGAIVRCLDAAGLSIHDLAVAVTSTPRRQAVRSVEREPAPTGDRACTGMSREELLDALKRVEATVRLSPWEKRFVANIAVVIADGHGLTGKQAAIIAHLLERLDDGGLG